MLRSLDVSDPQALVHFPARTEKWHHHVLLARGSDDGIWVCLNPDLELVVLNFAEKKHQVLGRNQEWADELIDNIYCFDPISSKELSRQKRLAKVQAQILYAGSTESTQEVSAESWRIYGPGTDKLGEKVGDDIVNDEDAFQSFGSRGLALMEGTTYYCERVAEIDYDVWLAERKEDRDDRILGVHLRNGKRHLPLRDAMALMKEAKYDDWPFKGPRVTHEYLQSVEESGGFVAFSEAWERKSGVHAGSAQAHEHRTGLECLRWRKTSATRSTS